MSLSRRRELVARERHPCEGPTYPRAVIVHVPLPGIRGAVVDKRVVEAGRGRVSEQEWNRVAGNAPAANARGIEGRCTGVVEPQTRVFASARISAKEHH